VAFVGFQRKGPLSIFTFFRVKIRIYGNFEKILNLDGILTHLESKKFYFRPMKMLIQLIKTAAFACLFLVANSCNDDLNLIEPNKDSIPIIYGFLSLNDTATYLRVERSFVDIKRSAVELAKIADSLVYPANVEVYLVRKSNNERFLLQKIDGNTEGYRRDAGVFASLPNYLYKVKTSTLLLKPNERWIAEVRRKGETKPLAQAETQVIGNYENNMVNILNIESAFPCTFETRESGPQKGDADLSARFYDIRIIFNYDETVSGTTTKKQVTWQFASGEKRLIRGTLDPSYDQQSFTKNGRDFYEFLGNNIPITPGAARSFRDFDMEITAGGQEVIDLLSVGIANLGITGSQEIPVYTNVYDDILTKKTAYRGVFGSRSKTVRKGFAINQQSLEALKTGTFTKQLNFR
jgi:hypothetical protein